MATAERNKKGAEAVGASLNYLLNNRKFPQDFLGNVKIA